MKFIDIHTHKTLHDSEVLAVQNFIWQKDTLTDQSFFSIGIHPWYLLNLSIGEETEFKNFLQHPNCLAIGECGLDFHPKRLQQYPQEEQVNIFEKQIEWAYEYNKPIIIHCVRCFDRLLQIKRNYPSHLPWIIHGYTKNKQLAEQLIAAGFYLSFGKAVFQSQTNRLALQSVSVDKIFLETDEGKYTIQEIYQEASGILQIDLQSLQRQLTDNFKSAFIYTQE